MRPKSIFPLAGLLLLACIGFYATSDAKAPTPAATDDGLAVYFSPRGGCTEAVVDALGKAKQRSLSRRTPSRRRPSPRRWSTRTSGASR
jgi:hypothetical protein